MNEELTFQSMACDCIQCTLVPVYEDNTVDDLIETFTISLVLKSKSSESHLFLTTTDASVHIIDTTTGKDENTVDLILVALSLS